MTYVRGYSILFHWFPIYQQTVLWASSVVVFPKRNLCNVKSNVYMLLIVRHKAHFPSGVVSSGYTTQLFFFTDTRLIFPLKLLFPHI